MRNSVSARKSVWYAVFLVLEGRGERRGISFTELSIHVPARALGQFALFCPGYGSSLMDFG